MTKLGLPQKTKKPKVMDRSGSDKVGVHFGPSIFKDILKNRVKPNTAERPNIQLPRRSESTNIRQSHPPTSATQGQHGVSSITHSSHSLGSLMPCSRNKKQPKNKASHNDPLRPLLCFPNPRLPKSFPTPQRYLVLRQTSLFLPLQNLYHRKYHVEEPTHTTKS